ncbi:vWA domain-containing protein [Paracoccus alkenifer]|uniref:Ca-activated chloride channel family protein n=1 Tax=Paracoccus alkenifer TaxID=65735 RepID=A0A1H6JLL8_9RHOB|nr:VWA domain-containing protein [Paracoccus alkenifer]SEH63241.1 Ca-activated chloride channel family protein [Paracoccus alkenifer]
MTLFLKAAGLKAAVAALALGFASLPAVAQESPGTVLVLDASGSMWGQIDGVNKITIAREVVADILADFPAGQDLGLVVYGHRERGQCSDIQTVISPAPGTAPEIIKIVNELNPRGMTPMTDAVIAAAEALRHTEQAATVILVSDGIETCNPDPCAAARALARSGIDFTAHVIGFDVKDEAEALMQMQCIAEETGGRFLTADNARELTEALQQVVAAPVAGTFTFAAHIGDAGGGDRPVWGWQALAQPLPLVPDVVRWDISSRDQGVVQQGTGNPFTVELPFGEYEVTVHSQLHDISSQTRNMFSPQSAREAHVTFPPAPPQPEPPAATVTAPDQVVVGSVFPVSWQAEGLNPRDYVTIVPVGAKAGAYTDYHRIADKSEGSLRAPAEPGLHEVRMQTEGTGEVLVSTPIEVVDAKVTVTAPDQVVVGSVFPVSWQAEGLNPRDYVTIVPMGAKAGAYTDYHRIADKSEGSLRAPAEPGLHEVRFQMEGSGRVLASTPIEVVDAKVTVTAPDQVVVGSVFPVSWQAEGLNPRDYVTIVPMGAKAGAYTDYHRIADKSEGSLRAPAEPGLHEVRFQMEGSGRVLAAAPVEVVEGKVTVSGPDKVRAGTEMALHWDGAIYPRDYITIVPAGTKDDDYGDYIRVGDLSEGKMTAPPDAGLYEIRYHLERERRVMARHPVEVLAADAPMDDGAGLEVPKTGKPGETITITWNSGLEAGDRRVAFARADQADFSWISAESITGRDNLEITLPPDPGRYELRFLDITNRKVLGRSIIEVKP